MNLDPPLNSVEWAMSCSYFNHGWLRNRFCISLKAAIHVVAGKVGRDKEKDNHLQWLEDWIKHEPIAKRLILCFADVMSPSVLFQRYPLAQLDYEDACFFKEMAHSNWIERNQIIPLLDEAAKAVESAGICVRKLKEAKDSEEAVNSGLVFLILEACQRLSETLSKFPRSIVL